MQKKPMTKVQEKAARQKLSTLERQLGTHVPLMRGSIVTNGARKQLYFSLNKDKRTRLMYLGEGRLAKAREMSENYKRLMEIVEEMTLLNMALLKNQELE